MNNCDDTLCGLMKMILIVNHLPNTIQTLDDQTEMWGHASNK